MATGLRRHGLMREDNSYVHPIEDGYGLVKNDVTLQAAITAIGAQTMTLMLTPGAWTIANDLTIPANITLYRCMGVSLSVAAGKTFTVLGQLIDDGVAVASGVSNWLAGPGAVVSAPTRLASSLPAGVLDGSVAPVTDDVKGLWFKTSGAWFPIGGKSYRPEFYPGADIGAKIQAAHDAMPATGGEIDCRAFEGTLTWSTPVTLSKSTRMVFGPATFAVSASTALTVTGAANLVIQGMAMWETTFMALTPAMQVIHMTSTGHLHASNFFVHNNGIPQTSGYFIAIRPATGSTQHEITRCAGNGAHEFILIGAANLVNINNCYFVNPVLASIHGTYFGGASFDAGTTYVTDCVLVASQTATGYAILWDDSSGLYVHNCTILAHSIGIAAYATQPHIYNEIMIYDNRIGQQGLNGVVIERVSGTGGFAQCMISNNAFGSAVATYATAVQLGFPGGASDILFSSVTDNRFTCQHASPCTLLSVNHGQDLYIAGNDFVTATPTNAAIGIAALFPRDIRIGRNKYTGFTQHATVTPPSTGVIYEPEVKTGFLTVDLTSVPGTTQVGIDISVPGLRPSHGDQIHFERNGNLPTALLFVGNIISGDDTARLFLYNVTGSAIDVGPDFWNYTWIDMVP